MLRFIERDKIKIDYLPETVVMMRVGGKANRSRGVLKGNFHDILKAFRVNGYNFPIHFYFCKLFYKIPQLLKKM
jgi:hypothetical protein